MGGLHCWRAGDAGLCLRVLIWNVTGRYTQSSGGLHHAPASDRLTAPRLTAEVFLKRNGRRGQQLIKFPGASIKDLVSGYDSIRRQNV